MGNDRTALHRPRRSPPGARAAGARILAAIAAGGLMCGALVACATDGSRPIPFAGDSAALPRFIGEPAVAAFLPPQSVPEHPFLAAQGRNGMHSDSYCTETVDFPAPLGTDPVVRSASLAGIGGEVAGLTFDSKGRIICVSGGIAGFRLLLLDPASLRVLASYDLPQRESMKKFWATLDMRVIMNDTSGGAYFHLGKGDRPIIAGADRFVKVFELDESGSAPEWKVAESYDLNPSLPPGAAVTDAIPDYDGNIWFITRPGVLGYVRKDGGGIKTLALGEEIQNSLAVAADGVYIVSDRAMYCFRASDSGPAIDWREAYDRGTSVKPGSINQGSGTTPTLVGDRWVAITDNADGRVNILVYDRRKDCVGPRLRGKLPVFDEGRSTSENSLISYGNALIVENNYLYSSGLPTDEDPRGHPGITRADIREDGSLEFVWESRESSLTTVPRFSTRSGLVYAYTRLDGAPGGLLAWYLTAIDFRTGKTAYKVLTGTGTAYNNNYAPITLGPDGTAYIGCYNGLISVKDGPRSTSP